MGTLSQETSPERSSETEKVSSRLTERSEETQDSHSDKWTLSPSRGPTSTSEFSSMLREDSNHTELTPRKPDSSSARSSRRKSEDLRFHTLLPTTVEPSDSHTQTSASTIPLSLTSPPETSIASSSSLPEPPSWLPEETTSVESVFSHPLRSIKVLTILLTLDTRDNAFSTRLSNVF